MKKDIALFFDIDGTLANPKTGIVPKSAIEEISEWRKLGYRCCIATGRCREDALTRDAGQYEWDGMISANGQEVYGPLGKEIVSHTMSEDIVLKALDVAKQNNQTLYLITGKKWIRIGEINKHVEIAQSLFGGPIPKEGSYTGQKVIYMIAFAENQNDYGLYEELGLRAATSYYHYADLVLPGYDKATGIQAYLKHEGIHHYYAFGDSGNDIQMLEHADYAVVMGNGDKEMFPYADAIAPSVEEDGLATILQKLRKQLEK